MEHLFRWNGACFQMPRSIFSKCLAYCSHSRGRVPIIICDTPKGRKIEECKYFSKNLKNEWFHKVCGTISCRKIRRNVSKDLEIREKCLSLQRERRNQVEPRCAERWHLRGDEQFDLSAWFPSLIFVLMSIEYEYL